MPRLRRERATRTWERQAPRKGPESDKCAPWMSLRSSEPEPFDDGSYNRIRLRPPAAIFSLIYVRFRLRRFLAEPPTGAGTKSHQQKSANFPPSVFLFKIQRR